MLDSSDPVTVFLLSSYGMSACSTKLVALGGRCLGCVCRYKIGDRAGEENLRQVIEKFIQSCKALKQKIEE